MKYLVYSAVFDKTMPEYFEEFELIAINEIDLNAKILRSHIRLDQLKFMRYFELN